VVISLSSLLSSLFCDFLEIPGSHGVSWKGGVTLFTPACTRTLGRTENQEGAGREEEPDPHNTVRNGRL
jgi:hypothetical protein